MLRTRAEAEIPERAACDTPTGSRSPPSLLDGFDLTGSSNANKPRLAVEPGMGCSQKNLAPTSGYRAPSHGSRCSSAAAPRGTRRAQASLLHRRRPHRGLYRNPADHVVGKIIDTWLVFTRRR